MRSLFETLLTRVRFPFLLLASLCFPLLLASPAQAGTGNLLASRSPSRSENVSNLKVLTDSTLVKEGEDWHTTAAAVFDSERAFVEYDLGQVTPIRAAYLQGDNNDEYRVTISEDGKTFRRLWTADPLMHPGMRERWNDSLSAHARFVRLGVRGGDRAYSVSEFQLFSEKPNTLPLELPRVSGKSHAANVRSMLLLFAAGFGAFLFASHRRLKLGPLLLVAGLPILAGVLSAQAIEAAWPLAAREVAFVRAIAAAIALFAVLRRIVPGSRWPAHKAAVVGALSTSALLAFAAFYNLGRPQFWNHKLAQPEFIHSYDMRVYQPFARHFEQLQYDGVYLASVLAYAEEQHAGSLTPLANTELRSLRDHRTRRVSEVTEELQEVRKRFTDERWAELRHDMRFFQDLMGPEFLSTLTDHGANATPVWVFFARLFLGHWPASEGLLRFAGLVDGLLLLALSVAMWRSFGLLPMLLSITVFGANDLYMFGTNWTGATLRHDWLVLLGFGACALKKEHWKLAGACLGLSAMIRAFPAVALIGVLLPSAWAIAERRKQEGKLPGLRALLSEHSKTVRVLGGAAATMLASVLITGVLYGFDSWLHWWQKVTLLNRDVGLNEVSLRALLAGADSMAGQLLRSRKLIYASSVVVCVVWIVLLARRRPLYQSMLLALPLVLVIFNPSNYYSHFVFLLALFASTGKKQEPAGPELASEPARVTPLVVPFHWVAGPLLSLCVAGYWASLDPDLERHFQDATVLLFVALAWLYANLTRRDRALKATLLA